MLTTDQSTEIKQLLQQVQQKRAQVYDGIRTRRESGEFKLLFMQIKELEQRPRAASESFNTQGK